MAKLKALVVDDASFVRDLVKRTVRNQFPEIDMDEAADGRRAQSLMSRQYYDLVLCDWEMPEMSGLELLRWVRQHDAYRSQPFIMVTSRGDKEHVVEAIREGVSDYLGKPFSAEALGKKIRKVMGNKLQSSEPAAAPGKDAFRQSADLLTGGGQKESKPAAEKPKEAPKPQAPEQAAPSGGSSSQATVAQLRFSESTLNCVIKGITLTEVRVTARRDETFPGILEQAVVDIDMGGEKVARLNGYVHLMQAAEKRMDTEFVNLVVRFVDDDPQKMEDLSHFIARFQR